MKKLLYCCLVLVMLIPLACADGGPQSAGTPTPANAPKTAAPGPDQVQQLIAAAQKERVVDIMSNAVGANVRQAISSAFKAKYGIDLSFTDAISAEITQKVMTERNAGIYIRDMGFIGDSTYYLSIGPPSNTSPLKDFLYLPEVLDGSKWRGGQLPYIDKDGHGLAMMAMSIRAIIINTDMVKPEEMQHNTDLLNPKWKGKIILVDPSVPGTASNWFTWVVTQLHKDNREEGLQFMRDLAKQEPLITRDLRMQAEWIAKGKYPVGIGESIPAFNDFQKAGAPIAYAGMGDRTFFSPGSGVVVVWDRAPHPNATKLFLNWLLSKEGAEIWCQAYNYPSMRTDVSNNWVDPLLIPPGDTPIRREDYIRLQGEMMATARDIFKDLMK